MQTPDSSKLLAGNNARHWTRLKCLVLHMTRYNAPGRGGKRSARGRDPSAAFKNNDNRLSSWKEIAAYLHRGIRTVQRWHAELQLPVHKSNSKARAHVFAYKAELDEWVRQRAQQEATRNVLSLIKRQRDRIARITDTIDGIVTKLRQQVGSRRNNVG